jgi:hypothetical protein
MARLKLLVAAAAAVGALAGSQAAAVPAKYREGYRQACAAEIADYMQATADEYARNGNPFTSVERQWILDGNHISEIGVFSVQNELPLAEATAGNSRVDVFMRSGMKLKVCGLRYLLPLFEREEADAQSQQDDLARRAAELQQSLQQQKTTRPQETAEEQRQQQATLAGSKEPSADAAKNSTAEAEPAQAPEPFEKAVVANDCISLISNPQSYGGFNNSCLFPVYVAWCAYRPKDGAWSSSFDCDKNKGGLSSVQANAWSVDHTHNAEYVFWFACKQPGTPKVRYTSGVGFHGTCR